ncbi:MAG TPA: hypothetical protein VGK01_24275 [Candidatus Angelobacter sp.]
MKLGKVMGFARRNYVVDGTDRESLMVVKNGRNGQVEPNCGPLSIQADSAICSHRKWSRAAPIINPVNATATVEKDASTNRFGRRLNTTVIL